ncbi:hypothetical protein DPMN_035895 [Dreissena polymorpha]|uniref:Uncharacterized protein n=1 Tax=Dreissena polymorpha TaxID=45954 RepID=A0A9D4M8F3_DREPO|nr:hypothetical protein DPMN_035895 [Dreissena polymorpha]
MARQRPTRLVMGSCIAEIDRIVIRKVHYQLEVNWCRNEEIIVKCNFGWVWSMWAGLPRNDHIVIREVQYQFEVNRCRNEEIIVKGNFGWVWSMWAGRPRVGNGAMHKAQYQFEVNQCRNEEIIVKGNFGLVVGPCIVEIDRIVIREVQYQFEVNQCRNEEIIGAPGLVMGPCIVEIDRIVIREVQYQFEVNGCKNEEVNFQGSSAYSVGGDSGQDRRKSLKVSSFLYTCTQSPRSSLGWLSPQKPCNSEAADPSLHLSSLQATQTY